MTKATIIILTKNAEAYLQENLEAIFNQDTDFHFEVLMIDSGSKDGTLKILSSYPVRTINIPPESFNHGETRNLGAREASKESQFFVYLSQDAKPGNPVWLQNLLKPFQEDNQVAGVFSRHVPRPGASVSVVRQLVMYIQSGGENRLVKKMPASLEEYEVNKFYYNFFSNTSSAIRRSVWQEIPFERVDFAEDALWADKVIRRGYTIVFEPSSVVIHSHNYSIIEQFRQNVDHAHGMNKIFHPQVYRSRRFWLRQFAGIPSQIARDCKFALKDPSFEHAPWRFKISTMLHSIPWEIATVSGGWLGAKLETMPRLLKILLSRQERIKSQ